VAKTLGYAFLAVALIIFGFAGLFSIGAPFLLTGLVMLICFPWRRRRGVLWPAIVGVWGFTLGYVLMAPLGCTQTVSLTRALTRTAATTICNGVFFDYSGGGSYNPPLLPAVLVGMVLAVGTALAVRALILKGSRDAILPQHS
jgi:hypothetical protein